MRTAEAALVELIPKIDDLDMRSVTAALAGPLRGDFPRFVKDLRPIHLGQLRDSDPWDFNPPISFAMSYSIMAFDENLQGLMPVAAKALIGLDQHALKNIQQAACRICGVPWPPNPDLSDRPYRTYDGFRQVCEDYERTFGRLMGYQQGVFPALPAPTWVFDT